MSSKYYTMEFIVNDIVFVVFNEKLSPLGINDIEGYYKVMGHDHIGIWLKHPGILKVKTLDKKGKPLPESQRREELIDGVFLATWGNIKTIMHFPDREGFDFPGLLDASKIGFKNTK
tara:strand:- start:334 stop:684 length:351 start_codon:yes stop_codon:yes gene_type:complete